MDTLIQEIANVGITLLVVGVSMAIVFKKK